MSCDEIRRYLSEYIDDHLEPKEKTLVDRHLSACPSCRKAFISMKDLVEELGSMERLEAPKGFLDQLHVRMNEGSRFSRFLRKLFIPLRIKIPLEFAGAALVLILVFSIVNIQKQEGQILPVPAVSKKIEVAESTDIRSLDRLPNEKADKEVKAFSPAAKKGKGKGVYGSPLELALRVERVEPAVSFALSKGKSEPVQAGRRGRPKEGDLGFSGKEGGIEAERMDEPLKQRSLPLDPLQGLREDVEDLIGKAKGKVRTVEYDNKSRQPKSIFAEIPKKHFQFFYKALKEMAELPATPPDLGNYQGEIIPVRIRFLTQK